MGLSQHPDDCPPGWAESTNCSDRSRTALRAWIAGYQQGKGPLNSLSDHSPGTQRPSRAAAQRGQQPTISATGGLKFLDQEAKTGQNILDEGADGGPEFGPVQFQDFDVLGREFGPKGESESKENTASIPIPGTPFRLTAEGRLHVAVDLQELLTNQGIPNQLAQRLVAQKDPEAVAKVLLNALYLQSQGKLQNGPGYIRAGIEDGYELLPQVASRLETRRLELADQLQRLAIQQNQLRETRAQAAKQAAVSYLLERLDPAELRQFFDQAICLLPEPMVRRNPTLSNPFIRTKIYELATGETLD